MNLNSINDILLSMPPISLAEMEAIRLMDRTDTKFVASSSVLHKLLNDMSKMFYIQTIDDLRTAHYATQYLDTSAMAMYLMHHNGKLNRQKVRIRSYTDSQLSFLEVKDKTNKGRTRKKRIAFNRVKINTVNDLGDNRTFLEDFSLFPVETLQPALYNEFSRMTFVNRAATERITIDFDISFVNCRNANEASLDSLIVLELKQDGRSASHFSEIMRRHGVKPLSFSKYCMGIAMTDTNIKRNKFKMKLHLINKLH